VLARWRVPVRVCAASPSPEALRDVGACHVPAILVLDKADRLDAAARRALQGELPDALVMSALDPGDGERLRARIDVFFARHLLERQLTVPYAQMGALSAARDRLSVLEEEFGDAVTVTVRGTEAAIAALEAKLRVS
jgi:GTP-binding protein HflX